MCLWTWQCVNLTTSISNLHYSSVNCWWTGSLLWFQKADAKCSELANQIPICRCNGAFKKSNDECDMSKGVKCLLSLTVILNKAVMNRRSPPPQQRPCMKRKRHLSLKTFTCFSIFNNKIQRVWAERATELSQPFHFFKTCDKLFQ